VKTVNTGAELLRKLQELQASGVDLEKAVITAGSRCCGGEWDGEIVVNAADEAGHRYLEITGIC
jgi:hypothetical protein